MEPIEIEFLLRDKLSDPLKKTDKNIDSMGSTVDKVGKLIKDRISDQKTLIKSVESDLKSLEKQYSKLSPGQAQAEMKSEIEACKNALAEEKAILTETETEYNKNASSAKKLSTELRELQDNLAKMRINGQQNSREYIEMSQRASMLSDTLGDLRTQTNILANDNAGLQGVMSGISGVSGAFTAATGIMGVFCSENEKLSQIQTKVQSAMAITMGIQQVMNTLNKDSAFRLVTLAKAKTILTTATNKLSVSLGISNVAAKALMATLTLGASLIVTGLVIAFNRLSSASKASAEEIKQIGISLEKVQTAVNQIGKDIDFDVKLKEACGASKKELLQLRLEAAKAAYALTSMNFENVSTSKNSTAEQIKAAREADYKAFSNVNDIISEMIIEDAKSKFEAAQSKNKSTEGPYGSIQYWENVIGKLKEAEKLATSEEAIVSIRKQLDQLEKEHSERLERIRIQTLLKTADASVMLSKMAVEVIIPEASEFYGWSDFEKKIGKKIDITPVKEAIQEMEKLREKESKKFQEDLLKISDYGKFVAQSLTQIAGSLYEIGEAQNNSALLNTAGWIDSIGQTIDVLSQGISAIASGDIAGIIQTVVNVFSKFTSAAAKHIKAVNEIKQALNELRYQYTLLSIEMALSENNNTLFGRDNYQDAINGVNAYYLALSKLNNFLGTYGKSNRNNRNEAIDPLSGLDNVKVVTGHKKTGLFGWGKGQDTYSSIREAFPEIISSTGEFDAEVAKVILSTQKMDEASKAALNHMIELSDAAKEAFAQLEDYLSNIFSSMGSNFMDNIIDIYKNGGKNAGEAFAGAFTTPIEQMITDMIYSSLFAGMFASASEEMSKLWSSKDLNQDALMTQSMDIIANLMTNANSSIEDAYTLLDYAKKEAALKDLSIFQNENKTVSQNGKAGVSVSITQETASEIKGILTSAQIHFSNIDNGVENIGLQLNDALSSIKGIEENTKYCKIIPEIKTLIEAIKRDGIKVS